jgi:hypothetical protein
MFAVVLEQEGAEEDDFPVWHSPANGASDWRLAWGEDDAGFVSLWIDEDPVQVDGAWDREVCGTFELAMEGTANGPAGSRHLFAAQADMLLVEAGVLVGTWDWFETWTSPEGESGVFEAFGRLEGERR